MLTCIVIAAAMGVLMHLLIMRPLRKATVLSRMIATLGVLLFLRELALRRWTSAVRVVSSDLPRGVFHTIADTNLGKASSPRIAAVVPLSIPAHCTRAWPPRRR
jgi:sulfate-transporting ATPase